MLALVFQIGDGRFALDCAGVIEVAPRVLATPVPGTPPYVRGVVDYRGTVAPVLDLCMILTGREAEDSIGTRMIMVSCVMPDGTKRTMGLLAEKVCDTIRLDEREVSRAGIDADTTPWLDGVARSGGSLVEVVRSTHLLPAEVRDRLFSIGGVCE